MLLENALTFTKQVNRKYDDQFAQSGAKVGATVNIRVPAQFAVSTGPNLNPQPFVETQVPLTINQQRHVDVSFSSAELTLSIQDFSERVLAPQMVALANQIDTDGLAQYVNVYNSVGTPGTANTTLATYLAGGVALDNTSTPRDINRRNIVLSPQGQADAVGGFANYFNDQKSVADQYLNGTMGRAAGFKWSMDQNVAAQTVGQMGGTPVVNGAGQTGSSLVTNGWTAAAGNRVNVGDVFTIQGVLQLNPNNKNITGKLQQFVATAIGTSDANGNMTLSFAPALVPANGLGIANTIPNANVSTAPASGAALTFVGAPGSTTPQGLAFHRDAFTLACVDLEDVSKFGAWGARVKDDQLGLSMRVARQYAIGTDTVPCRIDVLYGWQTIRPQMACRIQGSNT